VRIDIDSFFSPLPDQDTVEESVEYIRGCMEPFPETAVVLGSGWGGLRESMTVRADIPASEIPHFPKPSVAGHEGRLIAGEISGWPVALFSGRKHLYEGQGITPVVFPLLCFHRLGVKLLGLTNAAGAANPAMNVGDIVIVRDHIDTTWHRYTSSLPVVERERHNIHPVYDPQLVQSLKETGQALGLPVKTGIYAMTLGPFYESPAEVRCLGQWEADALGMSTVPEAIMARVLGMRVFALSAITNMGTGLSSQAHSHKTVQTEAKKVQPRAAKLLSKWFDRLNEQTE
jgi:purine-nucleoside phosphorylase